jgi:hypothetical protein
MGLHRRGLDVRPDQDSIVLWRWFGIRYWSSAAPLMVPEVRSHTEEYSESSTDAPRTRRVTTLWFGAVPFKSVPRKNVGRFMREIRSIVADHEAAVPG